MNSGCRLCGSNIMLVNIFELQLQDSRRLKNYIELFTGLCIKDDELGKFVCKRCCDVAILCFKFRRNAQKYAIRIRDALMQITNSPSTSTSTTVLSTESVKCNISASTSKILLRYPSLIVPKELYTENILPTVQLQELEITSKRKSQEPVTGSSNQKQHRIVKVVNTSKLSLKKPDRKRRSKSSSTDSDKSDDSNAPLRRLSKPSESDTSLLIPIHTFNCTICTEQFDTNQQFTLHMQNHKDTDSVASSSASTGKRRGRKRRASPTAILKLTPIDKDKRIRLKYPKIFPADANTDISSTLPNSTVSDDDSSSNVIDSSSIARIDSPPHADSSSNEPTAETATEVDTGEFKPFWLSNANAHEQEGVEESFMAFMRTHMKTKEPKIKPEVERVDAEVQTIAELDVTYTLDAVGPNEMDILSPELDQYDVPVSILKQQPMKDMTAFFIHYTHEDVESKAVDWSEFDTIDLQCPIGRTSTPMDSSEALTDFSTCSLPVMIPLSQYRNSFN